MIDFENFDHADVAAIYDRVTGPIGARVRIFPLSDADSYYDGKLLLLLRGPDDLLDALVIERKNPEYTDGRTIVQTIRWAAIESLVVLNANPES